MGVFTTGKTSLVGLNLKNPWWLSAASIDLDFVNARYYDSSLATGKQSLARLTDYLSCSRASTGYAKNLDGTLTSFGTDTLRIGVGTGLLVEDARTNLSLNSQDAASQTYFQNLTIGTSTTAPDGTSTGQKLEEDGTTNEHRTGDGSSGGTNGTTYTASIYVKAAQRTWVKLRLTDNSTGEIACWINLSNGATSSSTSGSWTGVSAGSEALANGWYRAFVTGTIGINASPMSVLVNLSPDGSTINYAGTVGSGIYAWGLQIEAGAFPSSYTPTTSSFITRAADAVTLTGQPSTILGSGTASVIFAQGPIKDVPIESRSYTFKSGSSFIFGYPASSTQIVLMSPDLHDVYSTLPGGQSTFVDNLKIGYAWDGAGRSNVTNNGTLGTDSIVMGTDAGPFYIFCSDQTDTTINNYARRATFWSTRLADATLQSLTAP